MRNVKIIAAVLCTLVAISFAAAPAHAQFGSAQAVELLGYTPGVDMPLFSVNNRGYNGRNVDVNCDSTFADGEYTFSIVQINLENVFPNSGSAFSKVDYVSLAAARPLYDAPVFNPTDYSSTGPAYTIHRPTRNFGRQTYTDAVLLWDIADTNPRSPRFGQTMANVAANTEYYYDILVSWPAGVGQSFGNTYAAGSTVLRVTYTITP